MANPVAGPSAETVSTSMSNSKLTMTEWQQQMETVKMRDRYILEHQMWTDCSFLVGPEGAREEDLQEIFCHRLYLAKSSPVFAAMLYGDLAQNQLFRIRITDATPTAFQALLLYIYTGSMVKYDEYSVLWELLMLAKKYLLSDTTLEECRRYLSTFMHREAPNVWLILEQAEKMDEPLLYQSALQLTKSCEELRFSCLITTSNFLEISQDFLLNIVLSEDLCWEEHFVYLACYFWSKYQASQQLEKTLKEITDAYNFFIWKKLTIELPGEGSSDDSTENEESQESAEVDPAAVKAYMEPFLPHIRLLSMDGYMLQAILNKYCCFTQIEKSLIYSSFLGCKFSYLPEEFCKSTISRTYEIEPIYTFGYIEDEIAHFSFGEFYNQCATSEEFTTNLSDNRFLFEVEVKFPTQEKLNDDKSLYYEETFSVILTNYRKEKHVAGPLTQLSRYGSHLKVKIHPPIDFHAGTYDLTVTVLRHTSGLYPTYKPRIKIISSAKNARKRWSSDLFKEPFPKRKRSRYTPY